MNPIEPFLQRSRIAYFSMEIALRPEMHSYAGGLGVLAGDTARSAADLELPMVFVSLVSRAGYVRQEIDAEGRQVTRPNPWEPDKFTDRLEAMVAVPIAGREVWIRPWLYRLECPLGHCVPVLLLDTDLDQNSIEDRRITDQLYGGDDAYRLSQEIVLGIGGARILQALGFNIDTYHMNEGHAALLTLHLLRKFRLQAEDVGPGESPYDAAQVRERCIFTTHTPIEAAFDKFSYSLVERLLDDYIERDEIKRFAGPAHLNMTRLALRPERTRQRRLRAARRDHQPHLPRLSRARHHQRRARADLDARRLRHALSGRVSALGARAGSAHARRPARRRGGVGRASAGQARSGGADQRRRAACA